MIDDKVDTEIKISFFIGQVSYTSQALDFLTHAQMDTEIKFGS